MYRSNRCVVVLKRPLHNSFLPLVALVDVEVLGAHVEELLLALREV